MYSTGPYEVDKDGYLHEEGDPSEDVMDLDSTEVLSLLDINHELLPNDEGVGFEAYMNDLLDSIDAHAEAIRIDEEIDLMFERGDL